MKICRKSVWKCGDETAGSTASRSSSTPAVSIFPSPKKQISTGRSASPRDDQAQNLIVGLAGLGLSGITEQQVEAALQKLYPQGADGVDEATQLRALFVDLMRQNRGDKVR